MGEHMTKIQHADKKAQQTQQQKDVGYGALFKIRQISSNKKLPVILCFSVCLQCLDAVGWAAGRASGL